MPRDIKKLDYRLPGVFVEVTFGVIAVVPLGVMVAVSFGVIVVD